MTMKKSVKILAAAVCGLTTCAALGAWLGGEFDLSWYTIDGGGGSRSTGGEFELSATIAQPDAGKMSGEAFTLIGGFWGGVPSGGGDGCTRDPEWLCDGDVDGDAQVNPVDSGLVQSAFGSAEEQDLCNYDVDCDGQINPVDSGIVQSLFGTCEEPREVCP